MVEPYLLAENGMSTSARTPNGWQNEHNYSVTERNFDANQWDDDDDDVQIISWAGPSRQTHTMDLNETFLIADEPDLEISNDGLDEFVNDVYLNRNGGGSASMAPSTSKQSMIDTKPIAMPNRRIPHTITSGQLEMDNNVELPHRLPQTLPQISVAKFAKEENVFNNLVYSNDDANILNDILDNADWMNEAKAVNHVNYNVENIENNFTDAKQQNQCQITNNFIDMNNSVTNIDMAQTDMDTVHYRNVVTEQLPNATVATATAPATPTITANDWDDIFSVINLPKPTQTNTQFEPNNPQPGPSTSNFNWHLPDAVLVNNIATVENLANNNHYNNRIHNNFTIFDQPPQPFPPVELPQRVPKTPQTAVRSTTLPVVPPRTANGKPSGMELFTKLLAIHKVHKSVQINQVYNLNMTTGAANINEQPDKPGPNGNANQMGQQMINIQRAPFEGAVPLSYQRLQQQQQQQQQQQPQQPPQQQANATPLPFQPVQNIAGHPLSHAPIVANIPIPPPLTIKRTYTGTIPIKVVRSTKQYETLVEMGFLKKDIETALRKFNLDLHETIEYLSEPKIPAKRRKKETNIPNQVIAEIPNQIQQTEEEKINIIKADLRKPANLYEELLYLEETGGIVKSVDSFDCDICMETIEIKDGIILRNCLHRYCKDCLNGTIVHSDEINIKCPYVSCEEMLQDREIRAVLLQDEYEKFLMKGIRVAQVTISGTVLCNLPDCNGWCICDDDVNVFKCPQCKNINCITCKAIHPERNCREYQEDLAIGDANGIISGQRRSEQAIQELINRNEAMKCPKCGILIMKREGCDYITCTMCKTGICWATRGPRHGKGGCGGCLPGKKCHKDCRGCH